MWGRGLARWRRAAGLVRRYKSRLLRCALQFEVVAGHLNMAIGLKAIKGEWWAVKRAMRAKTRYEQGVIADANQRRLRHRRYCRRYPLRGR